MDHDGKIARNRKVATRHTINRDRDRDRGVAKKLWPHAGKAEIEKNELQKMMRYKILENDARYMS